MSTTLHAVLNMVSGKVTLFYLSSKFIVEKCDFLQVVKILFWSSFGQSEVIFLNV